MTDFCVIHCLVYGIFVTQYLVPSSDFFVGGHAYTCSELAHWVSLVVSEPEEPDHDDQHVGGAGEYTLCFILIPLQKLHFRARVLAS